MPNYYSKKNYTFKGFRKSKTKTAKYDAILERNDDNKLFFMPFGSKINTQYQDTTGLGLYSHLDNNDKKKRLLFRKRFQKLKDKQDWNKGYTRLYFSYNFLW